MEAVLTANLSLCVLCSAELLYSRGLFFGHLFLFSTIAHRVALLVIL